MPAAIDWTPELETSIVDGILDGESICNILRRIGLGEKTFYRKRMDDAAFDSTIVRAQEAAQELNVDRTEEMAKKATVENWQLVQFQCRNAQWIAGKRKPKKYGDNSKVAVTGGDGGAIQIISAVPRPDRGE
jgi:pyruvate/2-oxoacid:ferredoxin oxidoreductase beta subunit